VGMGGLGLLNFWIFVSGDVMLCVVRGLSE